jgi:hypothetical protein
MTTLLTPVSVPQVNRVQFGLLGSSKDSKEPVARRLLAVPFTGKVTDDLEL